MCWLCSLQQSLGAKPIVLVLPERRQTMRILSFRHWKEVFGSPVLFIFILLSGCGYGSTESSNNNLIFDSNIDVQLPYGGDKYDASYSWTQNDVIINLLEINKIKQNPEYHTELRYISDSAICENIFVPESNRVYLLEFSRLENKWLLTQLLVNH